MKKVTWAVLVVVTVVGVWTWWTKKVSAAEPEKQSAALKNLEKTSDWCYNFDKKQNFVRCETGEVICYRFGKLEQCYPKPKEQVPTSQASAVPSKK